MANTASSPPADRPIVAITMVLSAMLVFVTTDATAKFLAASMSAQQIVSVRYGTIVFVLLPILLRNRSGSFRTSRPFLHLTRGLLLLVSSILFVFALEDLPLELCTAIGFVAPLYVTALSIPFLGEHVGVRRWAAVIIGFAGVLIILQPGGSSFQWAMLLPLASALCWAFGLIITRLMRGTELAMTILFYSSVAGWIVSIPLALPLWQSPTGFEWTLLIGLGAFNAIGQYLIIRAFMLASASLLAPFSYCSIVWAVLLGFVIFGSVPNLTTIAGTAVLISAGLYVWHRERVRAQVS
jgi:drug/metabolite transporter (DMT)-like permease